MAGASCTDRTSLIAMFCSMDSLHCFKVISPSHIFYMMKGAYTNSKIPNKNQKQRKALEVQININTPWGFFHAVSNKNPNFCPAGGILVISETYKIFECGLEKGSVKLCRAQNNSHFYGYSTWRRHEWDYHLRGFRTSGGKVEWRKQPKKSGSSYRPSICRIDQKQFCINPSPSYLLKT